MSTATSTDKSAVTRRPGPQQQSRVIMEAAIDLMASKGTRGVSVSQVCKAAGVSRDTYYRCFPDKDALVSQLYQTAINDHIEAVLGGWDLDYSDKNWLHRVFDQTIDAILEQHKVAQLLYLESTDPDSPAYQAIRRAYEKAAQRIRRWCKENHGEQPSQEYVMALLAATQWLVQDAILKGMTPSAISKAKQAAEQLFYSALARPPG